MHRRRSSVLAPLVNQMGGCVMKRKLAAVVGLVLVFGLLLFPATPRKSVRIRRTLGPERVLALSRIQGWDWGGSGGS